MKHTLHLIKGFKLFSLSFLLLPFLLLNPSKKKQESTNTLQLKEWTSIDSEMYNDSDPYSADASSAAFCSINLNCPTGAVVYLDASGNVNNGNLQIIMEDSIDMQAGTMRCPNDTLVLNPAALDCSNTTAPAIVDAVLLIKGTVDSSMRCNIMVTVSDTTSPTAVCQNLTLQLDAAGSVTLAASQVDNKSSDNCGIDSVSVDIKDFDCNSVAGATTVTLTATDDNSNTATCTASITIQDGTAPTVMCITDTTLYLDATGQASILPADLNDGSFDNCGITAFTTNDSSFVCADEGSNTVILTATDNNSNMATCAATVTVSDTIAPVAICQDITVYLDAAGDASITPSDVNNGSNDACGTASLALNNSSFTCANVGSNTVTFTVADVNSNTATCTATVTVFDTVSPMAICQDITIQLDSSGMASIVASDVDDGSDDACGIDTLIIDTEDFDCTNLGGATTVTLTATDNNANSATCTATVTVADTIKPLALCVTDTIKLDASGYAEITPDSIDAGSMENCDIDVTLINDEELLEVDCDDVGVIKDVKLSIIDLSGNEGSCMVDIVILASNFCPIPTLANDDPNIADPCQCSAIENHLDEEVIVTGSIPGAMWRITSNTGLLDSTTAGPPYSELAIDSMLTEVQTPTDTFYVIQGIHESGVGYTIEVSSPFYPDTVLTITNTCTIPSDEFATVGTTTGAPINAMVDFDADHDICQRDSAVYGTMVPATADSLITWTLPQGGGTILSADNEQFVKVQWTATGTYFVKFEIDNPSQACLVSDSIEVTVGEIPIVDMIDTTLCSRELLGVVFAANNVLADSFAGVFIDAGPNLVADSVTNSFGSTSSMALAIDAWINQSGDAEAVTYRVAPYFAGCQGDSFDVRAIILPEPVLADSVTTFCSDDTLGIELIASNIIADSFSITFIGQTGTATPGANTLSADLETIDSLEFADDIWTNVSSENDTLVYGIIPYTEGCAGDSVTYTFIIQPEPVMADSVTIFCSDDTLGIELIASNIVADSFSINFTSQSGSSTAGANTTAASVETTDSLEFADDVWTNVSSANDTLVYGIIPYTDGCPGDSITYTYIIKPEPVIADIDTTVCSDAEFGIVMTASNVLADSFSIVNFMADPELTVGPDAVMGDLETPDNDELENDSWTNQTAIDRLVTMDVVPYTDLCPGDTFSITVTIKPEPVLSDSTATFCSDDTLNIELVDINMIADSFVIDFVSQNGNATPRDANTTSADTNTTDASIFANDVWENVSSDNDTLVYGIIAYADGCPGDSVTYTYIIKPEPVIADIDTTLCSDMPFGIEFIASNIIADSFSIVNFMADPQLTARANTVTGDLETTDSTELADDAWENVTLVSRDVTMDIVPYTDGCAGDTFAVSVTILPEPVLTNVDTAVCSNEPFGITFEFDPTAVAPDSFFIVSMESVLGVSEKLCGIAAMTGTTDFDALSDMVWENTTALVDTIRLEVVPFSPDDCPGDTLTIDVLVEFCPIVCSNEIIVSLDDDCQFGLQVRQVARGEGLPQGNRKGYYVRVDDSNPLNRDTVDGVGNFTVGVFNRQDELVCWGTVTAEDKTAPSIIAPPSDTLACWLLDEVVNNAGTVAPAGDGAGGNDDGGDTHLNDLGYPTVGDNCGPIKSVTFSDIVENGGCDSSFTARITRRFTVEDSYGNTASAIQIIVFEAVPVSSFAFETDTDANDGDGTFVFEDGRWTLMVQDCSADSGTPPANRYPVYTDEFGNKISLNEAGCGLTPNTSSRLFDGVCGDGSFKEERSIDVFDWCAGNSSSAFSYIVKVGDFEAPVFDDCAMNDAEFDQLTGQNFADYTLSLPDGLTSALNGVGADRAVVAAAPNIDNDGPAVCIQTVSTGPMDCTASINTSLASLRALFGDDVVTDCEDPNITVEVISYVDEQIGKVPTGNKIWEIGGYTTQGQMLVGLPIGFHALVITASDGCYNSAIGVVFFDVEDLTKPVMKCDDELRITLVDGDAKLGINGYAQATYEDVDEGSWDNCELVDLQVRRLVDNTSGAADDYEKKYGADYREDYIEETGYSKWDDIVEFFCADIDAPVEVQLRGTDSNGNVSTCWLNVDVENGLNYQILLDGGGWITCQEEVTQDNVYDFITIDQLGIQCNGPEVGVTITPELDQCGVGRYAIALDVTGGDNKNNNYVDPDPVYVEVYAVHDYWVKFPADEQYECGEDTDVAGVEVSEDVACDLLAISSTDERFSATDDPDACYKIFRTYRVINWCEYDSEALPVIVSRDWDAHNSNNFCDLNDDDDEEDVGEYFLNPDKPDGDGNPGDEDLYVIVEVDDHDSTGIVYYDNDADPTNLSTADDDYEYAGYWWAVTRELDCVDESTWEDGLDDVSQGSPAQDDDDNRYGSHGFWQYTQHIVVYDDSDPVAVIDAPDTGSENNFDCSANTNFTITITDACSIEDITTTVYVNGANEDANATTTVNGDTLVVTVSERRGIDNYKVKVVVNDGCGNTIEEEAEFDVFDDKAPAPICREDLVVELMPQEGGGAAMTVWASDFIASPIGDCSGQEDAEVNVGNGITQPLVTQFSINRVDSTVDETVTGLTVTCDDADNAVEVEVHAWDAAGNNDFCVTSILVQDNNEACNPDNLTGSIAGLVASENVEPIRGVEVQLSGSQSMMYQTQTNGQYQFSSLLDGGDFTVRPGYDQNHRNGVSTFDLVLIQKHILGVALLESPYKIIAADVNNSRNVSVADLIQLRKLILNIETELPNNTSWRFVDAEYSFPDISNPWTEFFPEIKNINNLEDDVLANFVGMKIGDVNGSATLDLQARSNEVFQVVASSEDRLLAAGQDHEIVLRGRDLAKIQGFQFSLELTSSVELVDINYGQLTASNLGVFQERGVITTSWDAQEAASNEELLRIVVRPTTTMALSDVLSISSIMTEAEAYNANAEKMAVSLSIEGSALSTTTKLYQNQPNPFESETQIRFDLGEASSTVISIQDMMGRTVKVIRGDFGAGLHEVRLKNSDLPASGIYYYTLEAGDFKASRKMILVGE